MDNHLDVFLNLPENLQKLRSCTQLFIKPAIPPTKLANAIQAYIQPALINAGKPLIRPEQVLMLFDDTVFGSAKEGFVVTEHYLIVKQSFSHAMLYEFSLIKTISWDTTFFSNNLHINGRQVTTLAQAKKEDMIAICTTLQRYLDKFNAQGGSEKQQQSSSHQQQKSHHSNRDPSSRFSHEDEKLIATDFALLAIDILSHFALYNRSEWTEKKVQLVMNAIPEQALQSKYQQQRIMDHLDQVRPADMQAALQRLHKFVPKIQLKLLLVMKASQLLLIEYPDQLTRVREIVYPFAKQLDVSDRDIQQIFDTIWECSQQERQHHQQQRNRSSPLPTDVRNARQILDITDSTLTEQVIQQAFRLKMKEFHPDRYQSLPESIRAMLESKTQEINAARNVLLD